MCRQGSGVATDGRYGYTCVCVCVCGKIMSKHVTWIDWIREISIIIQAKNNVKS